MLPVAAVFLVWDAVAIAAHVWTYNPRFVTGIELPGRHPDRGAAVLHRDPAVRAAHLQRRRRHPDLPATRFRDPIGAVDVTGLGYTLPAVLAVIAVCALEFGVLRTGLFRRPAYWISMVIVLGFQILVDGWLTKLSAPIVIYDDRHTSGIRFPFDIPVEDFLFGFALVTAVLLLWERQRLRDRNDRGSVNERAAQRCHAAREGRPPHSTRARPPTTAWSAPTPDTTATCGCRRSACGLPDARQGPAPARRRLRHRRVHRRTAVRRPARRDRRRRRVGGHAGRGRRQALARDGAVRAQPHRGPRRRGVDGPFDGIFAAYLLRNLADPDAQLRTFRRCCGPGATLAVHEYSVRDSRLATAMWNAVCATIIIPLGRLRSRRRQPLPIPAAQRQRLRRCGGVPEPAAGQRLHRCAQRDRAGLAAQHRAHLPRGSAAMTDPRRATPSRTAGPARRQRAGSDAARRRGRARASPGWPRRPGWPNAASPSTSSNGSPISAGASAAGPNSPTTAPTCR